MEYSLGLSLRTAAIIELKEGVFMLRRALIVVFIVGMLMGPPITMGQRLFSPFLRFLIKLIFRDLLNFRGNVGRYTLQTFRNFVLRRRATALHFKS